MIELPSVTLVCADCKNPVADAIGPLERCQREIRFGAVKFFTSLETDYQHKVPITPLTTLSDYSAFMLTRIHSLVDTPHMLVCQHDGWIINPQEWKPEWLNYDYIGPLWIQPHAIDPQSVGSGGFSFRSKKLMELVAFASPSWDGNSGSTHWNHEDGEICFHLRGWLAGAGMNFAPVSEAIHFAQGGNFDPSVYVPRPFGFHGLWPNIDYMGTGLVNPFEPR